MTPPRPMTHVSHDRISHAMVPEFLPEAEPETSGYLFIFAKRKESRDRTSTIELHRVDSGCGSARSAARALCAVASAQCGAHPSLRSLLSPRRAARGPAPRPRPGAGRARPRGLRFRLALRLRRGSMSIGARACRRGRRGECGRRSAAGRPLALPRRRLSQRNAPATHHCTPVWRLRKSDSADRRRRATRGWARRCGAL